MEILMEGLHGIKGSASTVIGVSGASGPDHRVQQACAQHRGPAWGAPRACSLPTWPRLKGLFALKRESCSPRDPTGATGTLTFGTVCHRLTGADPVVSCDVRWPGPNAGSAPQTRVHWPV